MTENTTQAERLPIDPHDVFTVAPVAVAAPDDVDCVIHNIETGATYRLNDVGTRVWELLESSATAADITTTIQAEYQLPGDVTPQAVADDVTKIMTDLRQFGLIALSA